MELQPKGCIHFQEREKQYSTLEKLVKAEIAELNNDKAEVDEKKKYVQKRLKTIAEVKMKNVIPKDNIIWNAATLIEEQLDESSASVEFVMTVQHTHTKSQARLEVVFSLIF